ncbi:tripartite motif-containing protein 2-like [Anneissia japonica]|uniref:tripartite motif-containing protein 2-like n=1 Tax=Anneissia japonica TaxID=1529436 RepID=UPI001425B77C|nr:tripartite motif-containing protein 2-like [Anneissia japonica]XP_033098228.1 tripartite motif-containing protein 2-like [Anneissia japonica]
MSLIELYEHKDTLNLKDMPEFTDIFGKLYKYYEDCGLVLKKMENGSIVFYLSANEPNALTHLWEIHSSGKLLKDLAQILVPEEHQQQFIDEWMTYIDENEYKMVLNKLNWKGFYFQTATSKLNQFLENVDEKVLECTICFKRLENPKSLTCLHSFCLACLENWVKTKGKLTCPTCSKSSAIPEGGLQKLPPNTFLKNLLDTIETFLERDQMICTVCEKEEPVKYYCQDCRQYLCSTCSDQHKRYRLFAYHKLHLMEDVQSMSPSQMTLLHPPLCSHHSKPLEFYCTVCKTPICVNCTIMDHKEWEGKHKPINISDAFQTFKETSAALEKSSQHFINKLEDGLKAVLQNATKLDQCKDTCLRDIDNHVEEIFKKVKENREKLKNEIETIYKRKKKVNDVQIDELKTTISDINTKLSFLNQLLKSDEGTAMQSSETVITALRDRINELPKTEPDDNGEIYYFINKQQMALLGQCDIGTVTELRAADSLTLKGEESVIKDQTFIVKIIKTDEHEIYANQLKATWTHPTGAYSISQVQEDNGDYFVTGKCTSLGVFQLDVSADDEPINQSPMIIKVEDGRLVNTIKINATNIRDVVKCEDDSILVSCLTNEILKYRHSGEYIGKVTLPQGVKVHIMYKMKNGNIAFSDYNNKPIRICNMNGQLIKTIGEGVLPSPVCIHLDETSNVLYAAVSNCVYMFDMNNGKTIKTIGSEGTKEGQMIYVIDVTLTNQGHLLVLEYGNSRLQLFNNEGRFIKVLVEAGDEDGKVKSPSAVVVDEDDNIIISSEHKLQLFSSDGNFIKRIDKPEDRINNPWGFSIISYHPRRLAVANYGDNTVKIFNY